MNRILTAATCVVLALTGCSEDEPAPSSEGPAVITMPVSGNKLLVAGPTEEKQTEHLVGEPTFVNGCLGAEAGDKTFLVVWPSGTTLAGNDDDTLLIDGKELAPGDSFVGTGGYVDAPFPEELPDIPPRCLAVTSERIAWVQEITEIRE